jgi:hypothetical protein
MLLCGESERAAQYLAQLRERRARFTESEYQDLLERKARGETLELHDLMMRELEKERREGDSYYLKMRALFDGFTRDAAAFCAQRHAREASVAKELKLDGMWEPSPFPIELPAAEQRRAADALFSTTPWITQRPSPLMALPAAPGEVRFAVDVGRREGRLILIAPLTGRRRKSGTTGPRNMSWPCAFPTALISFSSASFAWIRTTHGCGASSVDCPKISSAESSSGSRCRVGRSSPRFRRIHHWTAATPSSNLCQST